MAWLSKALSSVIGFAAEKRAQSFLQKNGLAFIARNFRCKVGEIDLIMQQAQQLVFVEVKYRATTHYGHAAEFLHQSKRRKLVRAVHYYLHTLNLNPAHVNFRLDLVAIDGTNVQWYKHI